MTGWTTPADVRALVRRRWDNGTLLRAYVRREPAPLLEVKVRRPAAGEIAGDLARVRAWQQDLLAGGRSGTLYEVATTAIGGRAIGRSSIPNKVSMSTYQQYWRLLGVTDEVKALDRVLAVTTSWTADTSGPGDAAGSAGSEGVDPHVVVQWIAQRPLEAIRLAPDWGTVLAALDWLLRNRGRGTYLREVDVPGVHTKFIERHHGVLSQLIGLHGVEAHPGRTFAARHGFAEPERALHLRLDPTLGVLPGGIDAVALPLRHAQTLDVDPATVLVLENQVTFLSVPIPRRGVVVWGAGFDALRLGSLPWLRRATAALYWGDLDTHGFAILHGLRTQVPQLRSLMMDLPTLFAHEDRWGSEERPTRAELVTLAPHEQRAYLDLVEGVHGARIRLEQERLDWAYCLRVLGDAFPFADAQE